MEKQRLDLLMVQKGLAPSREKAKAFILSGQVLADGKAANKAGETFPLNTEITLKAEPCPYVSRGGLKLEKAMAEFSLSGWKIKSAWISVHLPGDLQIVCCKMALLWYMRWMWGTANWIGSCATMSG